MNRYLTAIYNTLVSLVLTLESSIAFAGGSGTGGSGGSGQGGAMGVPEPSVLLLILPAAVAVYRSSKKRAQP